MKNKITIEAVDSAGVTLNKFEIEPSVIGETGKNRVFITTKDKILGYFKILENPNQEIIDIDFVNEIHKNKNIKINWFDLTFQQKLLEVHKSNLFPEYSDKNRTEFLNMLIERLIDKTDNMTNDEIEKFLGYE